MTAGEDYPHFVRFSQLGCHHHALPDRHSGGFTAPAALGGSTLPPVVGTIEPDGTVKVWAAGWCVHFRGGSEPWAHREDPPEGLSDMPDGVRQHTAADVTTVRYGNRLVALTPTEYHLPPTTPSSLRRDRVHLRRSRRV